MSKIIEHLKQVVNKSSKKPTIIYAEGNNAYIQEAAKIISKDIEPILVFKAKKDIPNNFPFKTIAIDTIDLNKYAQDLYEIRKHKGMTLEQAKELVKQPNYLCPLIVKFKEVDGEICGIDYTTKDTLKPALQILKIVPGAKLVSSVFVLENKDEHVIFSDCAININPNSEELANMAEMACHFAQDILNINKPRCALLSYSTCGSAIGESVEKVQQAMKLIKPSDKYEIFGEMQFDAAYDDRVRAKKAKACPWKTRPNIFIFPNIDAGNIGCKIAQRMGKYSAFGPILIGLSAPVNDLSRGATVEDVIGTSYFTAAQIVAQWKK